MPILSIFTPCGLMRMTSDPSYGETIYDSIVASESSAFDMTDGTPREARAYAMAMGLADARCAMERAGNQIDPPNCNDLLPDFEQRFGLAPGTYDTLQQRQAALAAKMLYSLGAIRSNVVASLRSFLGTDFLALRALTAAETTTLPSNPASAVTNCIDIRIPPKFVQLVDPMTTIGSPISVLYTNANQAAGDVHLMVGDVVVANPGHTAQQEKVTVTAVSGSGATRKFTATFTKSHDIGSIVTTMDYPYQWSTRRTILVIVKATSARDAAVRRRIDETMRSLTRSVDTWAIVQPTVPGGFTVGPMTIGSTMIGTAPLGVLPFVLDP